jgi:hypothetical protein
MIETDDERQARANEETYGLMYDQFAGRYWHCTPWRSLRAIMACGAILPNTGQFKVSYPQTPFSYVYREGCVAIFDFVSPSRREILAHAWKWESFVYGYKPVTVAFDLDPDWVERRIVRAADVTEPITATTRSYRCPIVEAWIREPIPFVVVTAAHLVASRQLKLVVDQPLTLDKFEAGRVDLTQQVRRARRQQSPDGGLELLLRRADRSNQRSVKLDDRS